MCLPFYFMLWFIVVTSGNHTLHCHVFIDGAKVIYGHIRRPHLYWCRNTYDIINVHLGYIYEIILFVWSRKISCLHAHLKFNINTHLIQSQGTQTPVYHTFHWNVLHAHWGNVIILCAKPLAWNCYHLFGETIVITFKNKYYLWQVLIFRIPMAKPLEL